MTQHPLQRARRTAMRLMACLMPSCKEVAADVSAAMDRTLPLRKRMAIRFHTVMCAYCRRYREQLRLLRSGAQRYADPDLNKVEDALPAEAKERLKRTLETKR